MATFLQLAQRVRQETGTAGTGPTQVTGQSGQLAQLVSWVAQAYLDIANKWHDWAFLWREGVINCTPGQADYSLPADSRRLNEDAVYLSGGVLGADRARLCYLEYDQYRRNKYLYDDNATPAFFTIRPDGALRLIPAPDDSYQLDIEYWKLPAPLVNNTDNPEFDSSYHDAIVWRAVMFWAGFNEAEAEFQKANFYYEQAMARLEGKYLAAQEQYHSRSQGVDIVIRAE